MSEVVQSIIDLNNDRTIFKALGMVVDKLDADETIVSLTVDERHFQHVGLVHGGVFLLLAESAASLAGACTLTKPYSNVVALELNANHVRAATSGILRAHSRSLHRGKRTLVYEVRVVDGDENLISIARCTLMVIEKQ